MKNIITKLTIVSILSASYSVIFAAGAACSAHNGTTNQYFTATGDGATQVEASQNGQNTVMQICKQGSGNSSDGCVFDGCTSYQ